MTKSSPRINGPRVFGVRPGHPFLYAVPATGPKERRFNVRGLPSGLELDPGTGLITGTLKYKGSWKTTLEVKTSAGKASQRFNIICGEEICLTPPMGWNSWNCWGWKLHAHQVLASARAMAANLKDHAWTYVNIDDTWQGKRNNKGALQPNEKFPDMEGLCRQVHALGLKVGIYSTPWITSYAGYPGGSADNHSGRWKRVEPIVSDQREGRYSFERADAKQWARWGIDYLKYDWSPNDVKATARMARALRASGRDIVYSLSNTAPPQYAKELAGLANAWRTTGDIKDYWDLKNVTVNNFHGVMDIWRYHHLWRGHQRPGHYNDADMLVLGSVGWGKPRPTRLTREEQRSHFSLWVLFASPLLLGCPLDRMDAFTRSLVTHDEVIDVHQDSLCIQAYPPQAFSKPEMWVKPLEDGSLALGLFNHRHETTHKLGFSFEELGLKGVWKIRDLWRREDLGNIKHGYETRVPGHGVRLFRIFK